MDSLSAENQEALVLFDEVTAHQCERTRALQILQSCNWNVEQAIQLHLAAGDGHAPQHPFMGVAPDLPPSGLRQRGSSSAAPRDPSEPRDRARSDASGAGRGRASSVLEWLARGLYYVGVTFRNIVCAFIFGPGGPRLGGGHSSGASFARALTDSYGPSLELPNFFDGSFAQALRQAQQNLQLLVVFLHSEHARDARRFCTSILADETVRNMLNENFVLWGGDTARMEAHHVAQMVRARRYPCFCILLPASVEEIRVLGTVQGDVQVEEAVHLLMNCLEQMETHRAEIMARNMQHVEDRELRQQQDREFQEALEVDRKLTEQREIQEKLEREAREIEEAARRKEEEEAAKIERAWRQVEEDRKQQAQCLQPPGPDCTASIALRLPAGPRAQRKFNPSAPLKDVYAWANCVAHLPENEGKGWSVPMKFVLKTSFPTRELVEMDSSIADLQLSGTNLMLAEVEEEG
mmetsp:Transcript_81959/g.171520  ORF Transcript_81959/g.171520 Transcript_81959/m.171520 type:complete len:464 (-) Transcript_81959:80-1471(-)